MSTLGDLASPELVASIQSAAQTDPAFASAFFADPKGAYRRHFAGELLPGYDVKIERAADGRAVISVPGFEDVFIASISSTDELSDNELEFVSAGACIGPTGAPKVPGM